ncbi:MAG: glycosyltransferase family 4 protein [Acetobacteraceae bacterium]|nr:glycosyltransferase family 4 protein [Acetobacteraceae bacterium]
MPASPIAIVLPPREGFGPGRTGAVGLIARRLASVRDDATVTMVVGGRQAGPLFAEAPFLPVTPVRWLPAKPNIRYAAGVANLLRRMGPALIEVHNRADIALHLARRLPRAPVSLFLHNDPQGMGHLKTAAERERLAHRLACVVAVSGFVRDRFAEGLPPGLSPAVLPNCIDFGSLPAAVPAGRRDNLILYVGRLVAEKGPDVFVDAASRALARLPGWRAEIVGADRFGPHGAHTPFIRTLRAQAAEAGISLLGYRPHEEVLASMGRAAIVVVPSRWQEPFGLTALEALACGAALVCSPRGGLPDVGGEAALYAEPDDPGSVAAAILALALDPARRATLGEAGRRRAALFDVSRVGKTLLGLRRELLARPPARAGSVAPR